MIYSDPNEGKVPGEVRVTISIPNMGYTPVEAYANRLMNLFHLGKLQAESWAMDKSTKFRFFFSCVGRIFTPVARDEAAKHALETDSDYLFMIDDDMMCPDDMFEKLYAHNVDIVAPLAFTRNAPHKPVMYSCVEGYDHVMKKDYFVNHAVMKYPKNELVECDAVGFGAVLIKTDVLRKVKEKNGSWFMSTCGTGEDIYFCYKAKKTGARVFMDTSVKLGHLSHPLEITEEYVEEFRKKHDDGLNDKKFRTYDKYAHKLVREQ